MLYARGTEARNACGRTITSFVTPSREAACLRQLKHARQSALVSHWHTPVEVRVVVKSYVYGAELILPSSSSVKARVLLRY